MNNKTHTWILAGIMIVFLMLRLINIGTHPQHVDESFAIITAEKTFPEIIQTLKTQDPHPPLYYSIMKIWIEVGRAVKIVPPAPIQSHIANPQNPIIMTYLRLPGIVFSFLTLLLLIKFGRKIYGDNLALIAAAVFSISRLEAFWAASVRYHTLLMLLALSSTYIFYLMTEERKAFEKSANSARLFICYTLTGIAGLYVNYFMSLILFSHLLILLFKRKFIKEAIFSWIIVGALFSLWLPVFFKQLNIVGASTYGTTTVSLSSIPLTLYRLLFSYGLESATPVSGILYFVALLVLGFVLYFSCNSNKLFIWIYTFTPMLILFLISFKKPLFSVNYFLISFPGYCLFLSSGIGALLKRYKSR